MLWHGLTNTPVLSHGSSADPGGHDVLYPGRGNVHDAHGRAHWHLPDQEPEPAGDRGIGIPSGVYRHHFRTGSPGSGGPGAGGAQYDADPVGGLRGWGLSGDRPPAYAVFHGPSAAPGGLLRRGICPGGLCAKGFFKRGL